MAAPKFVNQPLDRDYDIGGARALPIRIVSKSRVAMEISADAVVNTPDVAEDPSGTARGYFFRVSGGKEQFCVRFKSGAIQILATEPTEP